jgi:O-antigen/teichoic acid export membrane protein
MGFPIEQVGYLGLSIQAFSMVVYLAGIFSVSAYPWLVSSNEAGDGERFGQIQAECWRMSCILGGYLVACLTGLIYPTVYVILGEQYRKDIDLIVAVIRIGVLAGALMLVAEFHLRMLISLTQMKKYLITLMSGFALVIPYACYVLYKGTVSEPPLLEIIPFTWILPIGIGGIMVFSLWFSPKTERFYKHSCLAITGIGLALLPSLLFQGQTWTSLILNFTLLSLIYFIWCGISGLVTRSDLKRVMPG